MTISRSLWSATVVVAVSAVAGGQQPPRPPEAEQPPLVFKAEVNYVEVDARVTDEQGNFVGGLGQDDFQIYEEGKPQRISTFGQIDIPVERAERPLFSATPIEPDVFTNERVFDGRLYVILLDDLHTHALRSPRVKKTAREFVDRFLGANDLAAVVYTSGRTQAGQEFTSNRRLLNRSIDKFLGRRLRSSTLERIDEFNRLRGLRQPGERLDDPLDAERGFQARSALRALGGIAEWMGGLRGRRKALLFVSEGIDYDMQDVFNSRFGQTVLDEARDAIAAATRSNVAIYGIDPRGLHTSGDDVMEIAGLPDDTSLGLGPTSIYNEVRVAQDSLRFLADQTNGFAVLNQNDFTQAFDRIVRDNSSYYLLGYYPENDRRDGRYRKIEVRVRRPGLTVRARRGYVAPRGRAPETKQADAPEGTSIDLRDALSSPMPARGLTLGVFTAPFRGEAPNASVAVAIQVAPEGLTFSEQNGVYSNSLEISLMAVDYEGKIRDGQRQSLELSLKPQTYEAVKRGGFRVLSRLALKPGRYQLRAGVREKGAGRLGSVHVDLEVPDFSEPKLAMSGLVLSSSKAALVPTARPDEDLKVVLPGPPTISRVFSRDEEVALFADIYDNDPRPHRIDIVTTVTNDVGRVMFKQEDERDRNEIGGRGGSLGHTARIPLAELADGLYVLRVEVRSRLSGQEPVARDVLFRIGATL